jgi:hypothetical protein
MIQMTEPQVLPAPKTKPVPKRDTPKPKPRKNDPWTVPAPKVNPTPKANTTVMKKIKKYTADGKMIIDTKSDLDVMKSMMTKKAFYKKCVISMRLTAELLAEDAMTYVNFTDVSSVYLSQQGRRSAKMN